MKTEKLKTDWWHKTLLWLLVIIALVITIGIFSWRLHELPFASTPDAFSNFGDYVGGVFGAVTGLVSVIFLFYTYRKQIDIFEEQKRQTELQQFESTFFNLLQNFRDLLNDISSRSGKSGGVVYMANIRALIEKDIDKVLGEKDALTDLNALETRQKIDSLYQSLFIKHSDKLGHYFRSLYHLLKYIKEKRPNDGQMYFDIVQAQMNTDELYLTAINGISSYGRKKLHPLLNESSFLENLAIDENENIRKLVYFYYPRTKRKDITGVRKNVILVAGTQGTKKGMMSKRLIAEKVPARVTSIESILIRCNRPATEYLQNQNLLVKMIKKTIDPDDFYVVSVDFCQLYHDGTNVQLPISIFEDFNPAAIILLEASLDYIMQSINRADGYQIDETQAQIYQDNEYTAAIDYAGLKDVPLFKYQIHEMNKAIAKIHEIVGAFQG